VALVDTLESKGLARRLRSKEDRRANAIELTPKGRRVLKRADGMMDACEATLIRVLSVEEREQLTRMLERLLAASAYE
jgi:DNA-binding MarR family transcriptional regulator